MPPLSDHIVHKALASNVRREILLTLAKKDKYLTEISNEIKRKPQTINFHLQLLEEIGLVESGWREGKKYYSLREKHVLDFLRTGRPVPAEFRPKPPHEIMIDMWKDIKRRLDRLEKKVDKISKH
ncbi:MAG: winged helix-turn-helix transcriptional regulator [archaeon]|nr:MAG: winged helix-turn-helix transcriptional regulator [archaeon]